MHATVRRYEGVDQTRTEELSQKIRGSLTPRLSALPGFDSYYVIEGGNGVFTSVGLFETAEQAEESTRLAATWLREEKLEDVMPNPPAITAGRVIARKTNGTTSA
jgi:hypothetical protein